MNYKWLHNPIQSTSHGGNKSHIISEQAFQIPLAGILSSDKIFLYIHMMQPAPHSASYFMQRACK